MYPNGMKRRFQPRDYADSNLRRRMTYVRHLTIPSSSESKYMTSLEVFGENTPCLALGNNISYQKNIQDKISVALKLLTFMESHVLVQFWSTRKDGNRQLLTTLDQPFGFGVNDERLRSYRQDSECYSFIVDKDHEEEDHSPAARVFRRELPEWTCDINSYTPKQFPQQACAIRCSFRGYLGLPVFDPTTGLCVGVVEVLRSSVHIDFAYEVEQIHIALKTKNLITQQGFDFPYEPNERRQNDFDKIHAILKLVCDIHNLPLAQTWAVSQHSTFVAHEKVIKKSCSSFDTRCVGKVCMSTTALPFYVKDLGVWDFREACKKGHLDRSRGLVGKALLTRGLCFSGDVTKLGEQDYPLVHYARMNGLTGCFSIYLRTVEAGDDYVLEFYLPPGFNDNKHLLNLVQTLKQKIQLDSGFELGGTEMVTSKITLNDYLQIFHFPISSGLLYLKYEVARVFELEGGFRLKYMDEVNDEIMIANDVDLEFAVDTTAIDSCINLTCHPGI